MHIKFRRFYWLKLVNRYYILAGTVHMKPAVIMNVYVHVCVHILTHMCIISQQIACVQRLATDYLDVFVALLVCHDSPLVIVVLCTAYSSGLSLSHGWTH